MPGCLDAEAATAARTLAMPPRRRHYGGRAYAAPDVDRAERIALGIDNTRAAERVMTRG